MRPSRNWPKKGLSCRSNTISNVMPLGIVLTLSRAWLEPIGRPISIYTCPPAPHVLEAYNHKVNHDTHKELTMQECAVVQYAQVLQYTSFCNDERYKDRLAPAVHQFWDEVIKPFRSRALCNLHHSHLLGDCMHPNCGAKIPDYGVQEHIAFVCI